MKTRFSKEQQEDIYRKLLVEKKSAITISKEYGCVPGTIHRLATYIADKKRAEKVKEVKDVPNKNNIYELVDFLENQPNNIKKLKFKRKKITIEIERFTHYLAWSVFTPKLKRSGSSKSRNELLKTFIDLGELDNELNHFTFGLEYTPAQKSVNDFDDNESYFEYLRSLQKSFE
jgi:transposase-like protein